MSDSKFIQIIKDRGFIADCTNPDELNTLLESGRNIPVYIGFDCTAPSLHVGSLVQIMILRWLQKAGHKPMVLVGGGTTKVGDPSGKDESRRILSNSDISSNMNGIRDVFSSYIEFENEFDNNSTNAFIVNNADWLDNLNYIDFLRNYGKHFSINRMLSMESVKLRLDREQTLSFLEFNYMILQAYDFVELSRNYGCRVQIGGSDQWGNIVNGIELSRRVGGKELFGITTPLITTAGGEKMGKTADGAIWLNGDMCSPYDYWQFWRNTEDADVGRFLRLFTEIPLDEIEKLELALGSELNHSKIILANAATSLCHGIEAAKNAEQTAQKVFAEGGIGNDLPVFEIAKEKLAAGIPVFIIFKDTGLEKSGGAVRRLIKGGGAKINDVVVTDDSQSVSVSDINNGIIKLSAGKKRHVLIKAV